MLNFVIPGFYSPKHQEKGEMKNLIEVIGESDTMEGFFDIKGKKEPLSENYILENYNYFPTEKYSPKKIKTGPLEQIKHKSENVQNEIPVVSSNNTNLQTTPVTSSVKTDIKQKSAEQLIIEKIKTKTFLPNKPQKVIVTFNFHYDIEKIKNTCDFLDIDYKPIIEELISEQTVKQLIYEKLISSPKEPDIIKEPIAEPIIKKEPKNNKALDDALNNLIELKQKILSDGK